MILTIGCSFTAGEELPNPKTQAWPALVADAFGVSLKNLGLIGGSNDYIFRTAIEETSATKYDVVIIEWTDPSRMEVWQNLTNRPISVLAHTSYKSFNDPGLKWLQDFYKHSYNDEFAYKKWLIQVIALQHYFKNTNQRYIFTSLAGYTHADYALNHLIDSIDDEFYLGWPNWGFLDWISNSPKGPGGHPLEVGHKQIAENINEHIRNLGWLP